MLDIQKLLNNLRGLTVGVTVKPSLYSRVEEIVGGAYAVYPHPYQKEDICIFYDRKTLRQHLQLADDTEKGFTVTPGRGFDVTAALRVAG